MLRAFSKTIIANPCGAHYKWVKSHTDDEIRKKRKRTLEEKVNCEADALAKYALCAAVASNEFIVSKFPFEDVKLKLNNKKSPAQSRKQWVNIG